MKFNLDRIKLIFNYKGETLEKEAYFSFQTNMNRILEINA